MADGLSGLAGLIRSATGKVVALCFPWPQNRPDDVSGVLIRLTTRFLGLPSLLSPFQTRKPLILLERMQLPLSVL